VNVRLEFMVEYGLSIYFGLGKKLVVSSSRGIPNSDRIFYTFRKPENGREFPPANYIERLP